MGLPDLHKYPKSGVLSPRLGLNLADNKFEVRPDEALDLLNMLFIRDTLVQRRPFQPFSTTDFSTPGRFRGAHDYQAPGVAARLLFYTNNGVIKEWLTSSTEADRLTGLATGIEGDFSTMYDAAIFCNGSDNPKVGRGTTWRTFGSPAAVSNLAVGTTGAAGIAVGTYLHLVIPVIDVSGVAVVFGDWSNIVRTTIGAAVTSFGLTWTDVVDSRITRYLIFRTEAGGTDLRSIGAVSAGVGAFTDNFADASLPVTVSGGVSRPSPQYSWGVPPIGKIVGISGQRCVFGNLTSGDLQNALVTSRIAGTSYEAEGFPADGSTVIRLPQDGDLTALIPISTTDPNGRANDMFIAQRGSCYILPETNPDYPLVTISESLGIVSKDAWAKDGNWIFFKSNRGIEFWPGSGRDIYLISDKIQPIFNGGGNQGLTPNQSDDDIKLEIAENQLWITIRDDGNLVGPNKVYTMDLLKFRREFNPQNPSYSVRFSGPQYNQGLGFGILLRRLDGVFINFDNQNNRILYYDTTAGQDSIDGVDADMSIAIEQTGILRENVSPQKILCYMLAYVYTNTALTVTIKSEFDRILSTGIVTPGSSALEWADINWLDIEWFYDVWFQDVALEFCANVAKWFVYRFEKTDSEAATAFFGTETFFDIIKQTRTLR